MFYVQVHAHMRLGAADTAQLVVRSLPWGSGASADLDQYDDTAPIAGVLHHDSTDYGDATVDVGPFMGNAGQRVRLIAPAAGEEHGLFQILRIRERPQGPKLSCY